MKKTETRKARECSGGSMACFPVRFTTLRMIPAHAGSAGRAAAVGLVEPRFAFVGQVRVTADLPEISRRFTGAAA